MSWPCFLNLLHLIKPDCQQIHNFTHPYSAYTSDQFTLPAYKGNELIDHQNVDLNYHLAQLIFHLCELWTHIRNRQEMKDTIKWIISFVVLHNLLADLKDQWNELYEEDEPDSALVAEENIENSNNGIRDILLLFPILKNLISTSAQTFLGLP
ncbi:hypothetical protein VP01_114g5 [Puccinia sorghi]|uniref:DDE Tnp4 domain-containing protein n=1 Tax=Puccinia sorghi TaxID=27349 RepID=A0A0L6VRR6_9BASI|nr:hypothetical protein VP01_114g5 [Puccinia sorghi]